MIAIKMPALSPTMEEGTLAKWLVKEGDSVRSGDIMAEIETDKATMEFEAVDEGVIARILVAEGSDGVKVGTIIAELQGEDEEALAADTPEREAAAPKPSPPADAAAEPKAAEAALQLPSETPASLTAPVLGGRENGAASPPQSPPASPASPDRIKASPLARRLASAAGVELATLTGTGPQGRIVRADVEGHAQPAAAAAPVQPAPAAPTPQVASPAQATPPAPTPIAKPASTAVPKPVAIPDIPHVATKLSNIRKTIARRLTESKQQVPHIYLTVDVKLDALLALRTELNKSLASRNVKLSVNDILIKALAVALIEVPACNVMFTPDQLVAFSRADISVAVSTPTGLITPIVASADSKSLSAIASEVKELAALARDGKLQPEQYSGGTASISNMGMYGIKQFDAVINPPQGMILAVGAGEKRPWVEDDTLGVATIMSATGSFDHRAIDGADGAALMRAFKALVEAPLAMLA